MAVRIRLARAGAKKRPFYHLVVVDKRSPRDGRFIERVGYYAPLLTPGHQQRLVVKSERISYWLSVGARASDRVARLLASVDLMPAVTPRKQSKKPLAKAKAQERAQQRAEKQQNKSADPQDKDVNPAEIAAGA